MKAFLPINRDILKWARTSYGISVEDVAHKMGKTVDEILKWERGESSPTYSQLEKLAYDVYKRPVALFFFPEIPNEESPKADFRTLPDTVISELPKELIRLYRKAKVYQINIGELYNGEKPLSHNLIDRFTIRKSTDISSLADDVRKELNISLETQLSWKNRNIAFDNWRKAFDSQGIFIFSDAFRNDRFSGFCVFDEKYPVIFINNSMPASRKIFTLFHELGHLLYRSGGIDFRENIAGSLPGEYALLETQCNKFANECLVPRNALLRYKLVFTESAISKLADMFCVSREVILRNYLELNIIDENTYRSYADKWRKEASDAEEKKTGGGDYYLTQRKYLGDHYIRLAFGKYYQDKISIENLAEYLGMNVSSAVRFENYALR